MALGKKEYFTKEHFENNRGSAPAYLCELVVYCLELVSQLAHYQLKFRFKGGNSLLILLEDPQRFSIDVDIVSTVTKEYLTDLVDKIVKESGVFSSYEIRPHKTKPWLPMISYKLFFRSFYQVEADSFVMLDCVLEKSPYEGEMKQVKCGQIYQSAEFVEVPTTSGLIADKLLTIGPQTLGIPIGKNKEAQRLKHIFDVILLLKSGYNMEILKESLVNCIIQENLIQKSAFLLPEIINDTKNFCSQSLSYGEKPDLAQINNNEYLYEIVKGFDEFKTYLFKINYTWERFKKDCEEIITLLERL